MVSESDNVIIYLSQLFDYRHGGHLQVGHPHQAHVLPVHLLPLPVCTRHLYRLPVDLQLLHLLLLVPRHHHHVFFIRLDVLPDNIWNLSGSPPRRPRSFARLRQLWAAEAFEELD